ncbi:MULTISPECIES: hypothetical protein [Chryseobacterium]|uniref:Uncharacterized protein n=1 Tax=Chryseobacterium taihuense TaxID=1141221 RepID=A0A4V6IDK2_9FLAO|nr:MULTISPECIES: hypothetical protein [Chryseobacterium]QQV02926.1 hypothetical protein I6I61_00770 [Chryseobacterium sp. FDAARGOS 1104]VFB03794.1 Uncharacterised protein [Chryseobacterium taihuense]
MNEYSSIYGYIKINRDYKKSANFIKGIGIDNDYPFINTNMFSLGDYEIPFYYENPIFGFAATYKYFGLELNDWNSFILKIERILRNIDFENAQFHVESSIGDFTLYWESLDKKFYSEEKENDKIIQLTKTEEWYFGFGKRSVFGGYLDETQIFNDYEDLRNLSNLNFKYPIPKNQPRNL